MEERPPAEVRTRRLVLQKPQPADEDALLAIWTDPAYAFFALSGPATRADVHQWLAGPTRWVALLGDDVVGMVQLEVDAAERTAALGYGLARQYRGLGLATEAARAVVDVGFGPLGLARIWARADPHNLASVRVLEKLGMRREGLLRQHVVRRGERVDRVYYGLLRAEWQRAAERTTSVRALIRLARDEDYGPVCALFAEGDAFHAAARPDVIRVPQGPARSREFMEHVLSSRDDLLLVAEQNGRLVGLIRAAVRMAPDAPMVVPRRYIAIEELVVTESARRRGYAPALVEQVHDWARERDIRDVQLTVHEFNTGAVRVYERLGYATVSRQMRRLLP